MFASFFSKKNSPFLMFFLKLLYISKFSIFLFFQAMAELRQCDIFLLCKVIKNFHISSFREDFE